MRDKTKEQLIKEIDLLRKEVDRLKQGKAECGGVAEELHSERDKFRGILFSINAGVDIVTQDFVIEYQNEFLVQRFGDKRGEKCYVAYMHLDKPCEFCRIHEVLETGETQRIELVGGDGRDYELNSSAFVDVDGQVKVIEVVRDITEHKRAEETLQESEGQYRDLADLLPQTVFEMDERGNLTFANRSAFAIFGYTQNDFDRGLNAFQMLIPEDRDRAEESIRKVLSGEGKTGNEYTAQKKDGGTFPCIIYSSPIIHENKPVGLRGIIVDISERKRAEEQLEHSFIDLAETVSRAMSFRDPYTSRHQRRVAELARLVGERMGLDGDRLRGLYIGGLLHDIGKISTPESILSKPGELTDEEWNLVCAHAKLGYIILKGTNLPWPVADMALHHHERLDGSGYPHGISGDKLSLENRILGVCDVVEAMNSHRPYRPARSEEEVLEEIKNGRGTKFDANVVDAMLRIIEGGEFDLGGEGKFE